MKRIILNLVLIIIIILFSGCLAEEEVDEIEDLAFVSTIGVDKSSDGKGFLVTIRIANYGSTDSQGTGNLAAGYNVFEAKGETVYEALKNIQVKCKQTVFLGHNKSIVFGKEFAREGIDNTIDTFERNIEISGSNKIFIAESTANEALKENLGRNKGSETDFVNAMINVIKDETITIPIMLYQFTLEMDTDNFTSYAPLIKFSPSSNIVSGTSEIKKVVNFESTAVFKKNKLITVLSKEQTTGLLWMISKLKDETLVIEYKKDNSEALITVEIKNVSSKVKTELNQNQLSVKVACKGNAFIREISKGEVDLNDSKVLDEINKLINEKLKEDLLKSIEYAKTQVHYEYFGIAHAIHNQHPKYWKEISNDWDQIFQATPIEVSYNVKIKDIGMINEPASTEFERGNF